MKILFVFHTPQYAGYAMASLEQTFYDVGCEITENGSMDDQDVLAVASTIKNAVTEREVNTVFIPHHAPMGTEGDIKLAHNIKHLWPEKSFHLVDAIPLASTLKALTADSQFVISMRDHQLIFALSIGVTAVGIYVDEYTQAKLTGSFEALGLKPLVASIHDVENNLSNLVEEALASKADFQAAAQKVQQEAKAVSEQPYNLVTGLQTHSEVETNNKEATEAS